jgi:hypothetical protein
MRVGLLSLIPLAACTAASTTPSAPSVPPANAVKGSDPSLGLVVAQQAPPPALDAGPDGFLNVWTDPGGPTGGNNLVIVRIPSDGSIGCAAPSALPATCSQVPLDQGYYYTLPAGGMFDQLGDPISQPLGERCGSNSYEINCQFDSTGVWGMPPASLGCSQAVGNDFIGPTFCCPCP